MTKQVRVGNVTFGPGSFVVIAGPCSIEGKNMLLKTAHSVVNSGAAMLRGGAFKPRTRPDSFQGYGLDALRMACQVRCAVKVAFVTEVMDASQISDVVKHADMLQVGARNMQNFSLLKELAKCQMPILLKRGAGATLEEVLGAVEYLSSEGNEQIVLCERGIRTFNQEPRNTLDVSAVPLLQQKTGLPVIVDPSHAAGRRDLVEPLALAGIGAGADGLIIEVHPNPQKALCDGAQSMTFEDFDLLMPKVKALAAVMGRTL